MITRDGTYDMAIAEDIAGVPTLSVLLDPVVAGELPMLAVMRFGPDADGKRGQGQVSSWLQRGQRYRVQAETASADHGRLYLLDARLWLLVSEATPA